MTRKSNPGLLLTRRALRDVQEIFDYSSQRWGKQTADKYIDDLEAALQRLAENPHLLQPQPDFHPALTFYRVSKHLLVCDSQPKSIVVLTILHASQDIPARLAELQPTLAAEVEILHHKLRSRRSEKP